MSVNKVLLVGRVGQKPEVTTTKVGKTFVRFSVATNETWIDKNNQKQEVTDWHNIISSDKLADICVKYLDKGREVFIEGSLKPSKWVGKDGQQKSSVDIRLKAIQFLGAKTPSSQPQEPILNTEFQEELPF